MSVLTVTRTIAATPERVFDAWLDPRSVGSWLFVTPGGVMERVDWDARVGGRFIIAERRGEALAEHTGTFLQVERPRLLVFSFAAGDGPPTVVTVTFKPTPAGCTITLSHELDPQWAAWEERTRSGWTGILAGLARAVE